MYTKSEENYLKAIFKLNHFTQPFVSSKALSEELALSPSSITEMLKKLHNKGLVNYKAYKGAELSLSGVHIAKLLIRKHRLWETFLVQKLGFNWSQIHKIAEELEHIQSFDLIDKLDKYLGMPKYDPHGNPIPNKIGQLNIDKYIKLIDAQINKKYVVKAVIKDDEKFLTYLNSIAIHIDSELRIKSKDNINSIYKIQINKHLISVQLSVTSYILVH